MRFYGNGINNINYFTTNGTIRSLILGLKDIDKVDNLAIKLSMMSIILRFYYVNNEFSDKCLMSRTSRTSEECNENNLYSRNVQINREPCHPLHLLQCMNYLALLREEVRMSNLVVIINILTSLLIFPIKEKTIGATNGTKSS